MRKYVCWIVLDDRGYPFGCFDYTNGGFDGACSHCAYLDYEYSESYSMVQISG